MKPRPRTLGLSLVLLLSSACSTATPVPEAKPGGSGPGAANAAEVGDAAADAAADEGADAADADGDVTISYESCEPNLPMGFAPVPVTPLVNKACTAAQIEDFISLCLNPEVDGGVNPAVDAGLESESCTTWTQALDNDECFHHCLVSPYTSSPLPAGSPPVPPVSSWGPIIDTENPGTTTWFNVGACIALADPTQAECAQDLNDRFQCEFAACTAGCPIPTRDVAAYDTSALQGCASSADFGPCQTYAANVTRDCTLSTPDAGPAALCYSLGGNTAALTQLLTQQCGM
jgi:hypothetical protein